MTDTIRCKGKKERTDLEKANEKKMKEAGSREKKENWHYCEFGRGKKIKNEKLQKKKRNNLCAVFWQREAITDCPPATTNT